MRRIISSLKTILCARFRDSRSARLRGCREDISGVANLLGDGGGGCELVKKSSYYTSSNRNYDFSTIFREMSRFYHLWLPRTHSIFMGCVTWVGSYMGALHPRNIKKTFPPKKFLNTPHWLKVNWKVMIKHFWIFDLNHYHWWQLKLEGPWLSNKISTGWIYAIWTLFKYIIWPPLSLKKYSFQY